jgi:hypothetical protein
MHMESDCLTNIHIFLATHLTYHPSRHLLYSRIYTQTASLASNTTPTTTSNNPIKMVSPKSLLTSMALPLLTTAQPIDPPTGNTLEPRGYGWLEGNLGREAYRCEYWTNPFFDKIHLAGRNSTHTEKEIKDAAKEAGAVTGWKWEDMGGGDFDVRVSSF